MMNTEMTNDERLAADPTTDGIILGVFRIVVSTIATGYSEFFRPTNTDLQFSVFSIVASKQRPRQGDDGAVTARFDMDGRPRARDLPFVTAPGP